MKEIVEEHMHLIDHAKKACEAAGVAPLILPIRGGTDGCQLSFKGLPCPNLGTGGHAFHGPYEHISVEGMEKECGAPSCPDSGIYEIIYGVAIKQLTCSIVAFIIERSACTSPVSRE